MKKVIFSQILAGNGVTNFSGLFDENGPAGACGTGEKCGRRRPYRSAQRIIGGRTAGNLHGL